MDTKHFGRNHPRKQGISAKRAQMISFAVSSVLCILLLAFTAMDSEHYGDEAVEASITYTEPEKPREQGFWEIISDGVMRLFDMGK